MKRPQHIWIAFVLCLAVVLAAMGWISLTALRLDRAESQARRQAALEENVRLALWRMDSALAPLLARESAQPYFSYRTLFPVDLANGRMFNRDEQGRRAVRPEEAGLKGMLGADEAETLPAQMLVPSPLLKDSPPYVLLHFQFEPDGQLTSPRVPNEDNAKLAVPDHLSVQAVEQAKADLEKVRRLVDRGKLLAKLPASTPEPVAVVFSPFSPPQELEQTLETPSQFLVQQEAQGAQQQAVRGQFEYQRRNQAVRQQANTMVQNQSLNTLGDSSWASTDISGVLMTPLWIDGNLILARRITAGGRQYVQGCLLDWPAIEKGLIETIQDLLPGARLEPLAEAPPADSEARMLAALPLRLVPGAAGLDVDGSLSPIRLSLAVAWACVLVAASAVALLLLGVMRLSERRAAFVSAVTHELRTPLTTFRMYAEMLGEGMVPEDQKPHYLATLQAEASRLTHLVENVLSYARLERGRAGGRVEDVLLARLIGPMESRLADRARQAGMELVVDHGSLSEATTVRANPSAVEQILFNLVDNACKYAAVAADRRIHLEILPADGQVRLRVRDHGPGIAPADAKRLFRSFSKSAHEAANSAPGIGLGLALSHRLARDMGGRLRLDPQADGGASFVLTLPAVAITSQVANAVALSRKRKSG